MTRAFALELAYGRAVAVAIDDADAGPPEPPEELALARHYGFSMDVPWRDLPQIAQDVILRGTGAEKIKFSYDDGARRYDVTKPFEGVLPNMERHKLHG